MRGKTNTITRGEITFSSRHVVLNDLAQTLIQDLPNDLVCERPLHIRCGLHNATHSGHRGPAFTLGIQTEQFYDANGKPLWGLRRPGLRKRLLKHLMQVDLLLDLSPSNRRIYRWLPRFLTRKLCFGPYIFPAHVPGYVTPSIDGRIFIGDLADRRKLILESLSGDPPDVISSGLYGDALIEHAKRYRGIVNIHHEMGVYSEYPRILLAVNSGTPLFSEPLADELFSRKHYFTLDENASDSALETVYNAMAGRLVARYSFADFLCRHVPGVSRR